MGKLNEWEEEGDKLEFEYKGYVCLILRIPKLGHLCGYVKIPKDHKYHKVDYDDIDVRVHGGLTYGRVDENGSFHEKQRL